MSETSKFPAPVYRETVLTQVFNDAKRLFLPAMMEIDLAHVVMLAEQKIISNEVATSCLKAIQALDRDALMATNYDGTAEDLFFVIEQKLAASAGAENAGRIHTARSRNDLDMAMYRMVLREHLLRTYELSVALRGRLLALATEHRAALMPAYTHNQPAQPTTLGHYLMAAVEFMERDAERIAAAFTRINRSPLGACAITTTGFPINRDRTATLLGFRDLVVNSYGCIAAVDYLGESCSVLAVAMLSLGRLAQDLLLWSTAEFGFLRLSDGYVQISSIMPQKRNPVPLEHTRILASRAMTEANAVIGSLHNTPFADMNDGEDSLQPLADLAFTDGERALKLLEGALSEATFNTARMLEKANGDFLTVTELADTLVRVTGISFHQSHSFVAKAVKESNGIFDREKMIAIVSSSLKEAGIDLPEPGVFADALDAQHFVDIRKIAGGPAAEALGKELTRADKQLDTDHRWCETQRMHIAKAHDELMHVVKTMSE